MDRRRRVVEVHRPQRRRVDGVLRVVHPQAVGHLQEISKHIVLGKRLGG